MVGWLTPDLIPRRLSPHIHPYTSPINSDIPKYHPYTPKKPLQTPSYNTRHLQIPKDTARHLQKFKTTLRQSSNTPQTPLRNSETLSGAPKIIGLSGRSPMYVRNVVGLSGAVFRDVLRCIKVLHCAQGGIWRISPFGVESG